MGLTRSRAALGMAWAAVLVSLVAPPFCQAGGIRNPFVAETTLQRLAKCIDRVQRRVDEYGVIVPKSPDVWGESRLMQHRKQTEEELKKELGKFELRLNAAESSRDSAFLASALALQGLVGGNPLSPLNPSPSAGQSNTSVTSVTNTLIPDSDDLSASSTTNTLVPRQAFGDAFSTDFVTSTKGTPNSLQVSLEPTLYVDQLKRYLDHLNELRRINEGDDTSDSPGYSLNLIRIPVSITPGRRTREGWGAEITVTARPYLSDELLPMTFRDLVINDVANQVSWPVFAIADREPIDKLREALSKYYVMLTHPAKDDSWDPSSGRFEAVQPDSPNREKRPKIDIDSSNTDLFLRAYSEVLEEANFQALDGANQPNQELLLRPQFEAFSSPAASADQNRLRQSIPASQLMAVAGSTLYRVGLDAYDFVSSPAGDLNVADRDLAPPLERNLSFVAVRQFVLKELQASYEFLSQPGAELLWAHCTPELAQAVREHRRKVGDEIYNFVTNNQTQSERINDPSRLRLHIARRDYFIAIKECFPDAVDSTTANLSWFIIVNSALLNERLSQDMRELASTKNCPCLQGGEGLAFFGPNPAPEARMAFNQYVECRWPIHVFALDPATQDQNVASSFKQRRELQLVLAIAAANRLVSWQSLTRFIRRMEYDLETIELNRTDVGFSHGDDTFGWRFYPRVQAPDVPSQTETVFRDLLIGDQSRDSRIGQRRLEPGMRECVAIVVMPSFVPYVTVDTRTNWFRLADCLPGLGGALKRELTLSDAVDLSRDVTELRELSTACVNDAHLYRDGEVHRVLRTVDQLDRQLPLQTSFVQVPFENTLGGFEMFSSGVTDLAPELHGWYGAPGVRVVSNTSAARDAGSAAQAAQARAAVAWQAVADGRARNLPAADITKLDEQARLIQADADKAVLAARASRDTPSSDTTLFLVGQNFSVLSTKVIAGGQRVLADDNVELISRQVIRVTIPPTVSTVTVRDRQFVAVHLSNPYGVTGRLHIPVADPSPSKTGVAAQAMKADVVAEAKKAAEAAVQAKLNALPRLPEFAWTRPTIEGCACYSGARLACLELSHDPSLELKDRTPWGLSAYPVHAEFAAFIQIKDKDGEAFLKNADDRKRVFGFFPVTLRDDGGPFVLTDAPSLLGSLLADIGASQKLEEVRLHGYLRLHTTAGDSETTALPVVQLPVLTFKLPACPMTRVELQECPPGTAIESPFSEASPASPTPSAPAPAAEAAGSATLDDSTEGTGELPMEPSIDPAPAAEGGQQPQEAPASPELPPTGLRPTGRSGSIRQSAGGFRLKLPGLAN